MIQDKTHVHFGRFSTTALLGALREEFRRQRVTAAECARRLDISEATAKRWLKGQGLTLDRLQALCEIINFDLRDLIDAVDHIATDRFTLAQERVLAADRIFAFLFFSILNGWPVEDFQKDFNLPQDRLASYLDRLVRLGLIAVLPDERVKLRVKRDIAWRRNGPLIRAFDAQVKPLILNMNFGQPEARYVSDVAKLSASAREKIFGMFEDLLRAWHRIAEEDRRNPPGPMEWSSLLLLVRPFDMDEVLENR